MSLLFPPKLGMRQVPQASFAPDKSAPVWEKLLKLKFEAGHMVQIKINTAAIMNSIFRHKKNKDSKIHNNYKNTIKLNVIEF